MSDEKFSSILIRDFLGILALAFTAFAVLSLVTYSPNDPSIHSAVAGSASVNNLGGRVGAYLSDSLVQVFGTGSFFFPMITLILGWALIRGKKFPHWPWILFSGILFLTSLCAFVAVLVPSDPFFGSAVKAGGLAGSALGDFLVQWMNTGGAALVLGTLLFLSLLAMAQISVNDLIENTGKAVHTGIALTGKGALRTGKGALRMKERTEEWWEKAKAERAETEAMEVRLLSQPVIVRPEEKTSRKKKKSEKKASGKKKEDTEEFIVEDETIAASAPPGTYGVPPVSLLADPPEQEDSEKFREEILVSSAILEQKLADFGIQGKVVQVLPGPVITLYEFEPAPGVKVSRILSLTDDLALAMRATSLRILAPVPGKPVVGIEIPNSKKQTVYFKEIICSEAFEEPRSKLTLAIGKDNVGQPVVQDLATIPHLLMAGSTGSGKSVGLNAMICSILLNATPDEVKMIMVDPKMLELSIYDGIPHLIAPVVTNPKKAAAALQWAVSEMELRYKLMAEAGVRNITGYNQHMDRLRADWERKNKNQGQKGKVPAGEADAAEADEADAASEPPTRLPYIVIFIDELADLMMVAPKGVEESLTRLAQMARAAGIHLIVATQRPSVDVLTGIIKANFPARISYKVTSRVDSRTILDCMGADKLLGRGDMLFLPPGTSRLQRIHGAMVSDREIHAIVHCIKQQRQPEYQDDIFDAVGGDKKENDPEEEYDEKYDEAVALVAKERQGSISFIQRKLRIGYNRAARIIETMEKEGVVGPSDGIRPREVYVKPILFE